VTATGALRAGAAAVDGSLGEGTAEDSSVMNWGIGEIRRIDATHKLG